MIRFCKLLTIAVLIFPTIGFTQNGGEVLVDLESISFPNMPSHNKRLISILELPFYDDFSRGLHYPAPELWDGKHVLINTTYPINPKAVGVATFDAISNKGKLHSNVSISPFSADTLTSHPINLSFPSDTTVYLSFFFQPQGLGNQPDIRDSLVLEFFDPDNETWYGAWAAWADFSAKTLYQKNKLKNQTKQIQSDTLQRTFFMVHLNVNDSKFLVENFQFRFRNYASLSSNTDIPGLRGNSDHWHIDLVYLNKGRSYIDTLINDITFYRPIKSILKNYEALPWKHFNAQAQLAELTNPLGFPIYYRNLGPVQWQITRRFSIKNESNLEEYPFSGGAENIFAYQDVAYTRSYLYDFTSEWGDSAKFTFTTFLITDNNPETEHLRWNDTLRYVQSFKNYYAYDDGTAEMGYGIYGQGTQNGRVAKSFSTYETDWLVGVYMYFNRTFQDANQKYFRLAVWDDNNGKPGNIVYEQVGVRPEFTDSLNRFTLYKLNEALWLEAGTFYIGWIQTTTDMLNVGFDLNRVNNTKLFYNISGSWQNSQFQGSLMIRPVFGELTENPTSTSTLTKFESFSLFPNPASTHISLNVSSSFNQLEVRIFNMAGQQVKILPYHNHQIDVSDLPRGIYIVRLQGDGRLIGTQKLVIAR